MKRLLVMLMACSCLFAGCCNCDSEGECGPTGSSGPEHASTKLLVIPGSTIQIDLTVENGKIYNFINADGKSIMQGIELPVPVTLPDDAHFLTRNFIINIQQLKFESPGLYAIDLVCDGSQQTSIPLMVKLSQPVPPSA